MHMQRHNICIQAVKFVCSKCGEESATRYICGSCNSKRTVLKRYFGVFPPPVFLELPQDAQTGFWKQNSKTKDKMREDLIVAVTMQRVHIESENTAGKYFPIDVYIKRGYKPDNIVKNCSKLWCKQLEDWTFRLDVLECIHEKIRRDVVEMFENSRAEGISSKLSHYASPAAKKKKHKKRNRSTSTNSSKSRSSSSSSSSSSSRPSAAKLAAKAKQEKAKAKAEAASVKAAAKTEAAAAKAKAKTDAIEAKRLASEAKHKKKEDWSFMHRLFDMTKRQQPLCLKSKDAVTTAHMYIYIYIYVYI